MSAPVSPKIRHILCGVDGSEPACRAADHAAWLAVALGAHLTFVAVARAAQSTPEIDAYRHAEGLGSEPLALLSTAAEACLKSARNAAATLGHDSANTLIRVGKVAPTLLSTATEVGADTIVLGRHPHTDLRRTVMGSVSGTVSSQSRLNVLQVW